MGQGGEKTILTISSVKDASVSMSLETSGSQADLALPQASHFRVCQASVTYPIGLERLRKAKPALRQRMRHLGWNASCRDANL